MKPVSFCAGASRPLVKRALIAAAGAVALLPASRTFASITFAQGSSEATLKHDPDRDSTAVSPKIIELDDIPASSSMPAYHISKMFSSGSASTQSFGSIGHVTNSTTASFVLKPGTGVSQNDPTNAYPGASSLKLNIDTVWNVGSGGFGPLATGFISLGVGGVVGDGGYSKVQADLSFTDPTTGATLRSDWILSKTFTNPGSFAQTFTTSEAFSGLQLNNGQKIRIQGYVEFRASNAEGPTNIVPTDIEIGGAPPTATWAGLGQAAWDDPRSWVQPDEPNPEVLPPVPNQPGHRARFVNNNRAGQQVIVNKPVTVGTLDVDGFGAFQFIGEGALTFQTLSGPSVLNVRGVAGSGSHSLLLPAVQFDSPLELKTESAGTFTIGSQMRGKGTLLKLGDGSVRLTNRNLYTGGTAIADGEVHADALGSLGNGQVFVGNALLAYNANFAANPQFGVQVFDGGVVDLGVVPDGAERFVVRAGGVISGNGQELGALTIGGNLTLEDGAVIAHTDFNTGPDGNPKGLGTTPKYLFGLSESEFEQHFVMGSTSNSPWRGIGSTRGDVTFGTSSRFLGIATDGEILVPTDGILRINATMIGPNGVATTLRKTGAGKAILTSPNNLAFTSLVERGTLQIDGAHPGNVSVSPGAILSGTGNIGGLVTTKEGGVGAHIAPGASIGALTVAHLELTPDANLDYELDTLEVSDRINVTGNLVLDGKLNITEMPNFDRGTYFLMGYGGTAKNNGLEIGEASDLYAYEIEVVPFLTRAGGTVRLNVLGEKQWDGKDSQDWNKDGNWVGPVPNGAGARANFLRGLEGKNVGGEIDLNGTKTVGRMKFDNEGSYGIIGKDTLQFDNAGNGALIEVETGRHSINVPIALLDSAEFYINENHALSAPAGVTVGAGRIMKKTGEGGLDAGPISLAPGAKLNTNQGILRAAHVRGGTVMIREGAVLQIKSSATGGGTSKVDALTIEGTANAWEGRLDLRDNDLIVQSSGADRLNVLSRVHNQVKTARNSKLFLWLGNGIGTSAAQRDTLVGLAVALNDRGDGTPLFNNFGGLAVDANSVLVKFTYNGDANLDGRINSDDYFRIDSGFLAQPANPRYTQGDFNYDGKINSDDYFQIDSAFLGQGAPLEGGVGAALAAVSVPEPSGILLALAASGTLLRRRRRRSTLPGQPDRGEQ